MRPCPEISTNPSGLCDLHDRDVRGRASFFHGIHTVERPADDARKEPSPKRFSLTGGSADYYRVTIPDVDGKMVTIECNAIIKHFRASFAGGNIFKAAWRLIGAMAGVGKPGNTALYDAEKIIWFGEDIVKDLKAELKSAAHSEGDPA